MREPLDRFFEKLELCIKKKHLTTLSRFHKGSSIKDVCTNLGIFGTPPPPVQICPHWVDYPLPPSHCPCGHNAGII